jgi:hypothetical protein
MPKHLSIASLQIPLLASLLPHDAASNLPQGYGSNHAKFSESIKVTNGYRCNRKPCAHQILRVAKNHIGLVFRDVSSLFGMLVMQSVQVLRENLKPF